MASTKLPQPSGRHKTRPEPSRRPNRRRLGQIHPHIRRILWRPPPPTPPRPKLPPPPPGREPPMTVPERLLLKKLPFILKNLPLILKKQSSILKKLPFLLG
jgi:hypothetical protein